MPAIARLTAGSLLWLSALLACSPSADAPRAHAGLSLAASAVSARQEQRRLLLDELAAVLRERYVDPPVAERAISAVQTRWQSSAYDGLVDDGAFAEAVGVDLRAASADEHLAFAGPRPATQPPPPRRKDRRFGFGESERLDGDVAVLPIFGFVPLEGEPQQQQLADSLSEVADASALILDLRANDGGRALTMAVVASYFFEGPPLLLLRVERRYDGASYELWTQSELRGTRFGASKPLFVLTSGRTFSGGEGLAYELQVRGRALVIGEATRGGNGLVERRELSGGFLLTVPTSIAINGATGQSRKGPVVPDVAVAADRALVEAHRRALDVLARRGSTSG